MPTRSRAPLFVRLVAGFVFEVVSAAVVVGVPGTWLVRHADLGRLAGVQASAALGRAVTIASLQVTFGPTVTVELADAMVANVLGAAAPAAITLRHLSAALDRRRLLQGAIVLERVEIDGLSVLLERTAERLPNWRFGAGDRPPAEATGRPNFPSLRDVKIKDSQVVYRLASGHDLVTKLDDVAIETTGDDQPVRMTIAGSYNGTPVTLDADLQPITALRDTSKPYGTVLQFGSGPVRLTFDGTMTDPLNFDGLNGTLQLDAEDPKPLFAIAGLDSGPDVAVHLDGPFEHKGPLWRLHELQGQLGTDAVTKASLDFEEGAYPQPDKMDLDLAFASLNLNDLLGTGARGKRGGADMSLAVSQQPGTLLQVKLTAGRLDYAELTATNVSVAGAQTPGRVVVDTLSMQTFGTRVVAHGAIEAVGDSGTGHMTADVSATGAEVQSLGRTVGFGALPLNGRMDAQVVVDATARTLNVATQGARISAVAAMRGGSVQKDVVEKASTDLRSLFRSDHGMSPVTCLLAGVDMRGGIGTVAPLRLRAADGTISGSARFDLTRRTMDLTIGSEAKSTGLFALDIPVRVSGSFSHPSVQPAQWSAQGRALLAAADSLSALPPVLRDWARRYPCPPSR